MRRSCAMTAAVVYLLLMPVTWAAEISISNVRPLAFGSFAASSGGTVTVSTAGMCSAGGSVVLVNSSACAAAEFTVSGDPNATYFIELPSNHFVTLSGPGSDMTITDFTSTPSGANGVIGASGSQTLSVGGTLNVESKQAAGEYSGSFTVIVNYN